MQKYIILALTVVLITACDTRVSTSPPEKVIEKNTTVINPPAKEEKKVENNTTIINPSAPARSEESKTTTTTTKTDQ